MKNVNTDPSFSLLETNIFFNGPKNPTKFYAMTNPNPDPCYFEYLFLSFVYISPKN